jgi:hypothetical protein
MAGQILCLQILPKWILQNCVAPSDWNIHCLEDLLTSVDLKELGEGGERQGRDEGCRLRFSWRG